MPLSVQTNDENCGDIALALLKVRINELLLIYLEVNYARYCFNTKLSLSYAGFCPIDNISADYSINLNFFSSFLTIYINFYAFSKDAYRKGLYNVLSTHENVQSIILALMRLAQFPFYIEFLI